MSTSYLGLNYFPQSVNFYEDDAIELAEAKYGIKANGAIGKLMCKIFKEGYFVEWGDEQAMIFARKLGGEVSAEEMNGIIEILLEKNFFSKETYEKFHVLTSVEIQRVWKEATSRRKKEANLPYFLIETKKPNEANPGNEDNLPFQEELNEENVDNSGKNACNSEQSKVKQSIVKQSIAENSRAKDSIAGTEEDPPASPTFNIPEYAYNTTSHNLKTAKRFVALSQNDL